MGVVYVSRRVKEDRVWHVLLMRSASVRVDADVRSLSKAQGAVADCNGVVRCEGMNVVGVGGTWRCVSKVRRSRM